MRGRSREPKLRDFFRTRDRAMRELLQTVEKVVAHDVNILILGESGVGKDYLAQAIHAVSPRRSDPFVHVECAAIPADLFESELFGYEKGAFTDAAARKQGKLEAAGAGTVYLDEIAALTPPLQAKLLRAIEERRYTRLGGHQPVSFAARIISSTNAPLESLLQGEILRRDLFYRINVVTLTIPPLRNRPRDIGPLASRFSKKPIADDAVELLALHSWPGNVRELRNVIERAAMTGGKEITADEIPPAAVVDVVAGAAREGWTLDEVEAFYIRAVLRETKSNYSRAAAILGINRKTLLEKRRKYGI